MHKRHLTRQVNEWRSEFRREFGCCWRCGDEWQRADYWPRCLDVHELLGGCHPQLTAADRRFWLLLCREHHIKYQDRGAIPYVQQLALKYLCDRRYFDLDCVHAVAGWAIGYIGLDDVLLACSELAKDLQWRRRPWHQ